MYFSTSPNGWSNNELGANWLINVFDRHTRAKAGNRRRLLIVDGHSSHLNMNFINLCDEKTYSSTDFATAFNASFTAFGRLAFLPFSKVLY